MRLNQVSIIELSKRYGWSQNELARQIGLSRGSLSNALSGRCGAGRKLLAAVLRLFPDESVTSLTVIQKQVAV